MKRDACKIDVRFNFLIVKGEPFSVKSGRSIKWKCKCLCDCGNYCDSYCNAMIDGVVKSCGCYQKRRLGEFMTKYSNTDISKHPLRNCYKAMKRRCYYKKAKNYLGGVIKVCEEWVNNYEAFYNWGVNLWSKDLNLTTIDSTKDYSPDNCTFVKFSDELIKSKVRETQIRKYGGHYSSTKEYAEKANKTYLEKYGTEWFTQSQEHKDKTKKTNLEKFGYEWASSNPDIKAKIRQTSNERYGCDSPMQNKEIQQRAVDGWMKKYGTPYFTKGGTKEQNQVTAWLSEQGFEFKSDYKILQGREIDLYNEDLKFGIEYCGLYWHSFRSVGNDRHKYKFDKCKENGITLFTIFSDEWLLRPNQTKSLILSALNKFEKTIDVKDCRVLELEPMRAKGFLNKNHILHSDIVKDFNIGIYYEGYLESVYSFIKDGNSLILDRFANSLNCNVIDGFQSVLPLAIKYCKENNLNSIVAISNNRYSNEDLYIKHGFQFELEIEPDYQYVKLSNPKSRVCKTTMNDNEEYDKIYDCGKKKFTLTI